jgi:iron complex outermembrane recepter protein
VHRVVVGMDAHEIERDAGSTTASRARRLALASTERLTMRATSTGRFGLGPVWNGVVTLGVDQSVMWDHAALGEASATPGVARAALGGLSPIAGRATGPLDGGTRQTWTRSNTGVSAHGSLLVGGWLSLDGGLRLDRLAGVAGPGPWVSQPSFGAAWNTSAGPLDVTFRGAFGRAIRWREPVHPENGIAGSNDSPPAPWVEQQAGVETGVDLRLDDWLDVRVTRFDQTASGLSQQLSTVFGGVGDPAGGPVDAGTGAPVDWNVGEIGNRGWEARATLRRNELSVTGALSTVDSRVLRTASGYEGELRPGDRMLGVPETTVGLTANWTASRWGGLLTVSRASDWIGYDHAALEAIAAAGGPTPRGPALRGFWREYEGVTRVGASARYGLLGHLDLTLGLENMMDAGRDDLYSFMVVAPRAVTLGMRLSF